MLKKETHVFARHAGLSLECDVYFSPTFPPSSPVLLFFHSGGLLGGSKEQVPPWLVQVCYRNKWPLVSAAYRLLPQASSQDLLEDISAAYKFAKSFKPESKGVIVGGASAGFFMATLTARHHLLLPPLALLSITGIPTFQHPFFSSSVLLTPEPVSETDVAPLLSRPVSAGKPTPDRYSIFTLDKLDSSGAKNPSYTFPEQEKEKEEEPGLYAYYLYRNEYPSLVGPIDPGYTTKTQSDWPITVMIHGNDDYDVSVDVSLHMLDVLGDDKVKVFVAEGQGHLFEELSWWEDEGPGMQAVRDAVGCLEDIIGGRSSG